MNTFASALAVIVFLVPTLAAAAEPECNTPITGRYKNFDHGYAFTVPAGYGGQWQSPCSYDTELKTCICIGNHGLFISIGKDSAINVFSAYATDLADEDGEDPTSAAMVASMIQTQRESATALDASLFRVEEATVRGNHGRRVRTRWRDPETRTPMSKVSYHLTTRFQQSKWPKAELTISLSAPASEFNALLPVFSKMLNSFQWLPDP